MRSYGALGLSGSGDIPYRSRSAFASLGDDHGDAPGCRVDLDALGALASEACGLERASDLALIETVRAAVGHARTDLPVRSSPPSQQGNPVRHSRMHL